MMHPKRRQRLLTLTMILLCVGIAVGLTGYAMRQNINVYYSPSEIVTGTAPQNTTLRMGGLVVNDSVHRNPDNLQVRFTLTDNQETVEVFYDGILPDLFREGQGIIVTGRLTPDGYLQAQEVLAKHDENYMPSEVADSLAKAAHGNKTTP